MVWMMTASSRPALLIFMMASLSMKWALETSVEGWIGPSSGLAFWATVEAKAKKRTAKRKVPSTVIEPRGPERTREWQSAMRHMLSPELLEEVEGIKEQISKPELGSIVANLRLLP